MVEHLLESTVFLACVWGATLLLSRQAAALRYRLWLAASLKFIAPLAPLVAIGRRFAWRAAPLFNVPWIGDIGVQPAPLIAGHAVPTAVAQASAHSINIASVLLAVWSVGTVVVLARWYASVRRVRLSLRHATAVDPRTFGAPPEVRAIAASWGCEPAIVGVWRPALVLPADITSRLTPEQLASVVAHELRHLRRSDNLTAAAHMLVEAMFWFHPGVWLIERRLVEERERACDEAVIGCGIEPATYAEAILQVCRHYVCAPTLAHAAVTGASLRQRVERIVRNAPAAQLSGWRRASLGVGAALVMALPIAIGAATGTAVSVQSQNGPASAERLAFDVASIKPAAESMSGSSWRYGAGRMTGTFTVKTLISLAFGNPPAVINFPPKQIVDGPGWLDTDRYAVNAEVALPAQTDPIPPGRFGRPVAPFLRSLLEDRFKLVTHRETREIPVYALVVARSDRRLGPGLRRSRLTEADCEARRQHPSPQALPCGAVAHQGDPMTGVPVERVLGMLGAAADRIVRDRTGLNGLFDIVFRRDETISIFTDVQEQLGLKLEPSHEPIDVIAIDHIERPALDQ